MQESYEFEPSKIQEAIDEVFLSLKDKESKISSTVYKCAFRSYLFSFISFSFSFKTLLEKKCYDTVQHICRGALERYAIVKRYLENFLDDSKLTIITQKLVIDEMDSDISDYYNIKSDKTILDIEQKSSDMKSMLSRVIFLMEKFFPEEYKGFHLLDEILLDKKIFVVSQLIKSLQQKYDSQFEDMNIWNTFIRNTLKNNMAYKNEYGKEVDGAGFTYSILSEASHPNFYHIDHRINYNNLVSVNRRMHNDDVAALILYWCLKDIALEIKKI